jgi:RNA polymerase sigma factor (sigma-70 family)
MTNKKTISSEDFRLVEAELLQKPAADWSSTEFDLFNEWFLQSGHYYAGRQYLMGGRLVSIKGNILFRSKMSKEDAEDTIQEWWIRFNEEKKFNPSLGAFDAYFKTGVNMMALNNERWGHRNVSLDEPLQNNDEQTKLNLLDYLVATGRIKGDASLPETEIMETEIRQYVLALIQKLKDKPPIPKYVIYANAVELRHLEGLEYEQIAAALDVTENYARQLVLRGMKYMARIALRDGLLNL